MYTNHHPRSHGRPAGHRQAAGTSVTRKGIPLQAFLLPGTRPGIVLVSHEARKYRRVNLCNVHYRRSVDPVEGTRPAQISRSSRWMLHTASPRRSDGAHLQRHEAGPALEGPSPPESPGVSGQTQPGVTRCWPVLCCPSPSCCCSPPWGQRVGEEARSEPRSKPCLRAELCLES